MSASSTFFIFFELLTGEIESLVAPVLRWACARSGELEIWAWREVRLLRPGVRLAMICRNAEMHQEKRFCEMQATYQWSTVHLVCATQSNGVKN